MSAIQEALSILLGRIEASWSLLEPILAAPENIRWLLGSLIVVALAILTALRRWRSVPQYTSSRRITARLGPEPSLLRICEYLNDLVQSHSVRLALNPFLLSEATAIAEDIRDQAIRLYVFGLQNAGKSTLVNALLGRTLSPESSGKKTTVLVRLRWGAKPRLVLYWPDGTREESLSPTSLANRMERWSEESNRPREAVIESPFIDLGIPHLEIVDAPGTGSAWTGDPSKSIEDEIVDRATRLAAVAIVVYRHDMAQLEHHERLLQVLGGSKVPLIGICNLKADWAQAYRANPKDVERVILSAEARLRTLAKAACFRVDLKQTPETELLARKGGACSVAQLRDAIVNFISAQRNLVEQQAFRRSAALISELETRAQFWIGRVSPTVDSLERQRLGVVNAAAVVQVLVSNPIGQGYKATAIGAGTGSLFGFAAMASTIAPPAAPVILVAAGATAAVGAVIGWFVDRSGVRDFQKQLELGLKELSNACRSAPSLAPKSFAARFDALAKTCDLGSIKTAVDELDTEVQRKLERVEEYHVFAAAKELYSDLQEIRTILQKRHLG